MGDWNASTQRGKSQTGDMSFLALLNNGWSQNTGTLDSTTFALVNRRLQQLFRGFCSNKPRQLESGGMRVALDMYPVLPSSQFNFAVSAEISNGFPRIQ